MFELMTNETTFDTSIEKHVGVYMIERKRTRDNGGILSSFLSTYCQNPGNSTPLLVPFPRAVPPKVSRPAIAVTSAASTNSCAKKNV